MLSDDVIAERLRPDVARLSSLLTRQIFNLFDLTSSCNHKCVTSTCLICQFHVDGECVLSLLCTFFQRCGPTSATPAHDEFLVSLSPAQCHVPEVEHLNPLPLSLQVPNGFLSFALSTIGFALCSQSRAPDSQRERQRVGPIPRVDTTSLSLPYLFSDSAP